MTTSHRRAMMRNLVTSILENGQATCTLARAKEVRKPLEKMITLAKRGDLHARRQALSFVKSKEAMSQLFGELGERYSERNGGYCRIIKLGKTRLGDNAEMAIVQLIGSENDQLSALKSTARKKAPSRWKSKGVLKEVSEEVQKADSAEKTGKSESSPEKVAADTFTVEDEQQDSGSEQTAAAEQDVENTDSKENLDASSAAPEKEDAEPETEKPTSATDSKKNE